VGVEGRAAVVTGGASGIGRGIAQRLADAGARVAILDIDATAAKIAAAEIAAQVGVGRCMPVTADLTDRESVDDAIRRVDDTLGAVDIVVNNAGVITGPTSIDELPERDWDFVVTTNTKSQYLIARAAVPRMKETGFGRIINIASRSWLGVSGRAHYAASKGAVISFTRSLAIELGPHGITSNCISPTLVITPLFERTPDQEAVLERVRRQPIPRPGTSDDIAHAVLFFADEASGFITGQHLYVGGGADLMTATP
jgi:NAD(P)-dependent dehydrogenase (short-subunit alcohol dehydrogenase family)